MKITTIQQGKERVEEIREERRAIMTKMQSARGEAWQKLCDQDYDLKVETRDVQSQMAKIFKANRAARGQSTDPALNHLNNFFGGRS